MFGGFVQHVGRLRQEEERFYKTFHSSQSMMSVNSWDDGCFVEVNQSFLGLTGYEAEEVVGRSVRDLELVPSGEVKTFVGLVRNLGSFRDIEGSYTNRNGETRRALYSMDTFTLNGRAHLLVSILDIADNRGSGGESGEDEGFVSLSEAMNDGLFLLDREGCFTYVNKRITETADLAREWFRGRHYLETVHPEDRVRIRKRLEALLAGEGGAVMEFRYYPSPGGEVWVEASLAPVPGKKGVDGVIGTVRNVTARKRADKELKKTRLYLKKMAADHTMELKKMEEIYRDLVNNSLVGIFQTGIKGHILFANEALRRLGGWDRPEEVRRFSALSVYRNPGDRDLFIKALSRTGKVRGYEVELLSKAGRTLNVVVNASLKGDVISGMVLDVSDRRRMEHLLRESEERYRNVIENAPVPAVISRARDGVILHANVRAVTLLKTAAHRGVGESFSRFYGTVIGKEEFARLLGDENFGRDEPVCLRDGYGGKLYVRLSSAPLGFNGEDALFTAFFDVTAEKYATDRLLASEAKYLTVFDCSGAAILLCRKYVITDCNKKALELFNCSRKQLVGQSLFRLYASDQPSGGDSTDVIFQKIMAIRSGETRSLEMRCKTPYGTVFDAEADFSLIRIDGEETLHVAVHDITERKQEEDRLRESEETYRTIFENAMEGIFRVTVQGRYLTANPALAKMVGYESPEELISSVTDIGAQVYVNPVDRARFLHLIEEYDYVDGFEVELRNKFDEKAWAVINARAVRGKTGEILYIEGRTVDITARKRAEHALMSSERKYRNLVESSLLAISQTGLDGRIVYLNNVFAGLLDLESGGELAGTNLLAFCRKPESVQRLLGRIRSTEVAKNVEISFATEAGRMVNVVGSLVCHGSLVTWMVMETESQKRMADELERKTVRLQEVTTALNVLLDQRTRDRHELEEKVVLNIKELVLPYVETLRKARLADHHKVLLEAIDKNLHDLTSPFVKNMYGAYNRFTPTEVRVATLIKDGKTAKEIACILGVSESAVNLHRQHIRNKLGMKNEKENLRSRLLSLAH